ncbi:hypothetical protein [Streptomyces sp. NBC_01750]|uniref:hypothetical protein n=1 Tax=Streptomyces sp. NBC_01750 TaxID=2975928 RepID=UPI002DDAFAA9|nr:hypothetical protein [Streptomyces sp. NBC_01750]WSD33428.1 hypothetical protein OG966_16850 [Streptomyces sp. NBC_01750]
MTGEDEPLETEEVEEARVAFRSQPHPIPADARVTYKLAQIALVLNVFNKQSASIENLHLFTWSLQNRRRGQMLLSWWAGNRLANTITKRSDPHLQVALNVGLIRGMVKISGPNNHRVTLAPQGILFARQIESDDELMAAEKTFLRQFRRLSDASVARHLTRSV